MKTARSTKTNEDEAAFGYLFLQPKLPHAGFDPMNPITNKRPFDAKNDRRRARPHIDRKNEKASMPRA